MRCDLVFVIPARLDLDILDSFSNLDNASCLVPKM